MCWTQQFGFHRQTYKISKLRIFIEHLMISIVLIARNDELRMREFCDSLISMNDKKSFEFIVVDGQSKDKTVEIAKSYGGPNAGRFVNGVLGTVYRTIKDQERETKAVAPTSAVPVAPVASLSHAPSASPAPLPSKPKLTFDAKPASEPKSEVSSESTPSEPK